MRLVFALVLIMGLGLAGFAVYMAKGYMDAKQAELAKAQSERAPKIATVEIFVAKRSLKYGEPITKDDVRPTLFPKNSLPAGTFATMEALFSKGENVNRIVLRAMEQNEAILAVKVTEPGKDAGLTSQLSRGMRAFAIKVDISSGVSGFLRPGDRVDIYWTGQVGGNGQRTEENSTGNVTKLIDTGVKLIAVDQVSGNDTTSTILARTVTVAVLPQQVAKLAQAQATGKLTLSLVGALDDTIAQAEEVDQTRLLGLEAEPVVEQAPVAKVCNIRTTRGGETIVTAIPCPE